MPLELPLSRGEDIGASLPRTLVSSPSQRAELLPTKMAAHR